MFFDNVKGVTHIDEPAENYHVNLQLLFSFTLSSSCHFSQHQAAVINEKAPKTVTVHYLLSSKQQTDKVND